MRQNPLNWPEAIQRVEELEEENTRLKEELKKFCKLCNLNSIEPALCKGCEVPQLLEGVII